MAFTLSVNDRSELPQAAAAIAARCHWPILLFEGPMGVGKTTLIQSLCAYWQVVDQVQSPTYQLVHEYRTGGGEPIYHFDFYRLRSPQEALSLGLSEYWFSGHRCLVEWPGRIEGLWPDDFHLLELHLEGATRHISVKTTVA